MWENKARTALAETFLAALKEDTLPWRKCWNAQPLSFSTGKPYRGINNLMLSWMANEKGYQDTRWLTYKQAQDHGWQVRKGEKSVRVEYWHYYDTKEKRGLDRAEFTRIQQEEPERLKDIRLAAYTYNVFNVEQIDGDVPPQKRGAVQDPSAIKGLRDQFLDNLGVVFREGGSRAFYSPQSDSINLPPLESFDSDYGYVCTLLHEAGHATGHSSRLDRQIKNAFGTPDYAREELRAEIASAFTAQALQLPCMEGEIGTSLGNLTDNHKAYIQSWIAILEKDPNELFAAIKDADKITDYLLERGHLLELAKEAAQGKSLSVRDLTPVQMEELKSNLYEKVHDGETQIGSGDIESDLTYDELKTLVECQWPSEIPDEIIYKLYKGISFTPEDFFYRALETSPTLENEPEDEMEM